MTTKKEPLNNGNKVDQTEKTLKINCAYDQLMPIAEAEKKINPKNPNTHPEVQVDLLAKIISYQGCRSPIVVSTRSGLIIKGHARLEALKRLGWTQVPVDWQDYENEEQEVADMVADNELQRMSQLDINVLENLTLSALNFDTFDLELLALPNAFIDILISENDKNKKSTTSSRPDESDNFPLDSDDETALDQWESPETETQNKSMKSFLKKSPDIPQYKVIPVVFFDMEKHDKAKAIVKKLESQHGPAFLGEIVYDALLKYE